MCKYCEYNDSIRFGANMIDNNYSEGDNYSITICNVYRNPQNKFICIENEYTGESVASSIDINFCPICGRKL